MGATPSDVSHSAPGRPRTRGRSSRRLAEMPPDLRQMSKAPVALGAAVAAVCLAGCSASLHLGDGVTRNSSSAPLVGGALAQDEWIARGEVTSADDGGMSKVGEQLKRYWFFQSQCSGGRCVLLWTRPIDIGNFTAELTRAGTAYTATFRNEADPCASPHSHVVKALGLITSVFRVYFGPGPDRMSASEHTFPTSNICGPFDRTIRWTATRVSSGGTSAPSSAGHSSV